MKDFKKKIFAIILIFIININVTACSVSEKKVDNLNYNNTNITEKNGIFMLGSDVAESDDGYYFCARNEELTKYFIAYLDKRTNESMPLCSKINCSHSLEDVDEDCDAYIDESVIMGSLFYYDGFLYYINRNTTNYMCVYVEFQVMDQNMNGYAI